MEFPILLPILNEIKTLSMLLVQKEWTEKNAGNFSIRIPPFPETMRSLFSSEETSLETRFPVLENCIFLVKEKDARFRDLATNPTSGCGLIILSNHGKSYRFLSLQNDKSQFIPTSELISHLFLQEYLVTSQSTHTAILHTHPLELIIFSHLMKTKKDTELNKILASMHVEIPILFPNGIGFVPYQNPGSLELAQASQLILEKHSVLLWEQHGCLAVGDTILTCFDDIDIMNKGASIFLGLRNLGF